jgi:hypothetical protein
MRTNKKLGPMAEDRNFTHIKELLWESYLILDHGDHDERLEMLDRLERYFQTFGKPSSK